MVTLNSPADEISTSTPSSDPSETVMVPFESMQVVPSSLQPGSGAELENVRLSGAFFPSILNRVVNCKNWLASEITITTWPGKGGFAKAGGAEVWPSRKWVRIAPASWPFTPSPKSIVSGIFGQIQFPTVDHRLKWRIATNRSQCAFLR
jgi:hypothetical protein